MRAALVTFYLQDCRVRASVCHCSSWEGAHISTSLPVPHLLLLAPPCHVLDFCTFISCHCSSIGIFQEKGKNSDDSIFQWFNDCLFLDQLLLSCFVIVSPAICPFKCFQELTWWCVGIGTARRNVAGFSQTHRFCYFITLDSSFTRESSFYSRLYLNEMTTTYNTICLYICNFHCYLFATRCWVVCAQHAGILPWDTFRVLIVASIARRLKAATGRSFPSSTRKAWPCPCKDRQQENEDENASKWTSCPNQQQNGP